MWPTLVAAKFPLVGLPRLLCVMAGEGYVMSRVPLMRLLEQGMMWVEIIVHLVLGCEATMTGVVVQPTKE
jgi:hypothetical protein